MSVVSKLQSKPSSKHHDVTVLGAGWSGLVACKYMMEEGLSVVALEKREDIGGVWLYSDDPKIVTVMKTTQCTSSSTMTEMSDFPMPEEIGMFPHHTDILQYLRRYADHFNLMPHIQLNTTVKKAEKKGDMWWFKCENGDVYTSSYLVVATGPNQKPNRDLENSVLKGFAGRTYHASKIKSISEEYRGKRLLVVGGGETGSDICMEFYGLCKYIYWSIPRGQHFFRKISRFLWSKKIHALDKASSRMIKMISPYIHGKPGLSWLCKWTTNGSLLAYQGHGIPEWRNEAKFFRFFINKNRKVLDLVDYEHLVPKAGIIKCEGQEVHFSDGTKQEFDIVIMSTGYKKSFPFLPDRYSDMSMREHYKFVLDMQDPSLAFIGHVRPVVGSVVSITELQARWVAHVYSKHVPLKSFEEREAEVAKDNAYWKNYFKDSSQRLEGLVELFSHVDAIAKLAGVYPDYWTLFKKSPRRWYVAYFAPYNAATFRLNEPKHQEQAIVTMKTHRKATLTNPDHRVHILMLLLRIFWFDWILDQLGHLKYRIQTSHWWPVVREWRVTRAANWVWTLPKKLLFHKL